MKHIGLTIASLAISLLATGPLAAEQQAAYPWALLPIPEQGPLPTKNCTFCHGMSAQGLATAPRLAGQRAAYIEKQLGAFREHLRDNPYSKLYMWNAVANLPPATGRALADYFSQLAPPRRGRRTTGPRRSGAGALPAGRGRRQYRHLRGLPRPQRRRRARHPAPRRSVLPLSEAPAPGMEPRLPSDGGADAGGTRDLSAAEIDAIASYLSFIDDQSASQ